MRQESATPDMAIGQIAARQHGVVSFQQLMAAGVSASGISRRVSAGRLHRVFRGVYAVGHTRLSSEGRWMSAVLACGEGASLSHRTAAELWGLLPRRNGPTDVTIPGKGGRRPRRGIRLHRSPLLTPAVTTLLSGIAVTTPARTLADLRRVATRDELGRATRQAEVKGLPIGERGGAVDLTRSELERRFLRLCHRRRLPTPEVNVRVGSFIVDFLWRDQRLIVETDGYRFHRGRSAFEADRARDIELKLRGYEVVRFTHRQVVDEAAGVAHTLRVLLA
jgi:very-short-patch-repair endonuclease